MNIGTIQTFTLAMLTSVVTAALAHTYTTIDFPGAITTDPNGINSSGEIVGSYADGTGAGHGFHFKDGAFTAINVPSAARTDVISINARGDIAGFFLDATDQWHGFVLSNGN